MSKKDYCDNCGYYTKVELFTFNHPEREFWFCEICSHTRLSRATSYPNRPGYDGPLYKSVGWIANVLLDNITKKRKYPREE